MLPRVLASPSPATYRCLSSRFTAELLRVPVAVTLRHPTIVIITLMLWISLLRREPHHVVITSVPRLVGAAYGPPLSRIRGLALTHLLSNLELRIPSPQLRIYSLLMVRPELRSKRRFCCSGNAKEWRFSQLCIRAVLAGISR